MRYAFILVAKTGTEPGYGTEEWKKYATEYEIFNKDAARAGVLKGGDPVQSVEQATTVRVADNEIKLHNEPFAELKEQIIGWYVFECDDLDDAISWAAKVPIAVRGIGAVEIRPVMDFS